MSSLHGLANEPTGPGGGFSHSLQSLCLLAAACSSSQFNSELEAKLRLVTGRVSLVLYGEIRKGSENGPDISI